MILKGFIENSNKKYINSQLKKRIVPNSNTKVKYIGVIFNADEIINKLDFKVLAEVLNIIEDNIKIIAFKTKVKDEEHVFNPTFSLKHLGRKGAIKDKVLQQFLNTEFDVLISYYKQDFTPLKVLTVTSKAKFKVGVLEADERLNDLIIKTRIDDFITFTSELKKYLNILNKI
ncbi:DUF6913 domain-containing protein [Lacinutrix jangbogonensis]|uniref:DUF6913 domain-containing protein n=1 Tax=Lacinutrix jangbogonensis TaxID=1469557 RepID=UPI00053F0635|nr:hypothetical protein [Lacinutrix jangbogonensis]